MATAAELQARDKVFIGGEWVEPQATETLEVINSSTEEVIGTIPACTDQSTRPTGAASSRGPASSAIGVDSR